MSLQKAKSPKAGTHGRGRSGSAQYLKNKKFAYLFNGAVTPNTGLTPLSDDGDDTPNGDPKLNGSQSHIQISGPNGATLSPTSPSFSPIKRRSAKPRTSSISVNNTKNQNEQLNAMKKEVDFLQKEVPYFSELYKESQQLFSISKRNKADTGAFALIQALTQWIHEYGTPAVKQHDEFKQSAETEILSMVTQIEKLTNDNAKLQLIVENTEIEKNDIKHDYDTQQIKLIKYEKEIREVQQQEQTQQVNENTINDLSEELEESRNKNKSLQEKYDRVEKYWKMTQSENDELRNKNYGLEEEIEQLKSTLRSTNTNMNSMKMKHQTTLHNLQKEHHNYAEQMRHEQEKLIQASHEANESAQRLGQMTPTAAQMIDANDDDIGASGITDDGDDGDGDVDGGMFSLANDIDVYEYEDDAWLDETDSDYDDIDEPEPEPEPSPPPEPEPEIVDKTAEFEMIKESHYQAREYKDPTKEFEMMKLSYHQEQRDVSQSFQMSSQKMSVEHIKKEQPKEESPEPLQFESESMKIEVANKTRRKSLNLEMSSTAFAHTPQYKTPRVSDAFASEMQSQSHEAAPAKNDWSSEKQSYSAKNEMIHKNNVPKPEPGKIQIKFVRRIEKKEEPKIVFGGKNFADRLKLFKTLEETRGGKPQVLDEYKASSYLDKWKHTNKNNKQLNVGKSMKNVHVTKATIPAASDSQQRGKQINIIKITKSTAHTLKPRIFGYMKIIKSKFIPKWQCSQQPRFFFCLDGLPSETNVNEKEPDFAKNRKHDFLVPSLFFFQDKDDYDEFAKQVKNVPTRDMKFQKLFAQYAKGIFPLHDYVMGDSFVLCERRLRELKKKDNLRLNKHEISQLKDLTDTTVLLCNKDEIHRFHCSDKHQRNRWIKKVNKLVDKRRERLSKINTNLIAGDGTNTFGAGRKSRGSFGADGDGSNVGTPASVIGGSPVAAMGSFSPTTHPVDSNIVGRGSRASMYKLSKIKAVEADFD